VEELPLQAKSAVAGAILDRVERLITEPVSPKR
jgi:hypothetical protein